MNRTDAPIVGRDTIRDYRPGRITPAEIPAGHADWDWQIILIFLAGLLLGLVGAGAIVASTVLTW